MKKSVLNELFLLLDENELPAEAVGMTDQSRQAKVKPHHLKSFPPCILMVQIGWGWTKVGLELHRDILL